MAVVDGPLSEERSLAVIAEVLKLVPGKPIRYVVSTHRHFDHSGGLRTYVAEGATIITHQGNRAFYDLYSPPAQGAQPPAQPTAASVVLNNDIRRLNLEVAQHVPIHGRVGTNDEFVKIVGATRTAGN